MLGSKGMLQVENVPKEPVKCFDKNGGSSTILQFSFPQRYAEAYLQELEEFLILVDNPSRPCPVTKEAVLLTSRIADACERSMKEGRMVILNSL